MFNKLTQIFMLYETAEFQEHTGVITKAQVKEQQHNGQDFTALSFTTDGNAYLH